MFKKYYPPKFLYLVLFRFLFFSVGFFLFSFDGMSTSLLLPFGSIDNNQLTSVLIRPKTISEPNWLSGPPDKGSGAEFLSNEILIKLKPQALARLKNGQSLLPRDTGISSLNKLNTDHKVVKMEKVVKREKRPKENQAIFRWYKITLPGASEIVKDEFSDIRKELSSSNNRGQSFSFQKLTENQSKGRKLKEVIASYRQDPNIEIAEPNYIVNTTSIPNDTYADPEQDGSWTTGAWGQKYEDLWGLKKIEADKAWDITTGSSDITVAVIDTGVDYTHPDIQQNIWTNEDEIPGNGIDDDNNGYIDDVRGWDFTDCNAVRVPCPPEYEKDPDNDPMDDNGHGTHVAGTIGAMGNNNLGIAGVNWQVKIMPLKFLTPYGRGSTYDAISALVYAADNGARVINNSWGGGGFSTAIQDAIEYAHSKNAIIVVAAGNDNANALLYSPANDFNAITVASTDSNDQKSNFSNFGAKIDVAAPGGNSGATTPNYPEVNILSLRAKETDVYCNPFKPNPDLCGTFIVNNDYYRLRGTSMAAPHVSGLAALILAKHPEFTNEEVRQVLRQSADKIEGVPFGEKFGYGRINAYRALLVDQAPPVARIFSPSQYEFTGGKSLEIKGIAKSRYGVRSAVLYFSPGEFSNPNQLIGKVSARSYGTDGSFSVNWDLSLISPDFYTIKLVVTDTLGNSSEDRIIVRIGPTPMARLPYNAGIQWTGYPAAADLDGDGQDEIITVGGRFPWRKGSVITVWKSDGSGVYPGWPQVTEQYVWPTISVGDVDGDGKGEIVALDSSRGPGKVYVWNHEGTLVSGWPKDIEWLRHNVATLADLDNDGKDEIIFESAVLTGEDAMGHGCKVDEYNFDVDLKIFVFRGDGSDFPGWPQTIDGHCGSPYWPAVGDITGDGIPEIVVGATWEDDFISFDTWIYAFSKNGELLSGWPRRVTDTVVHGPILADLDFDGKREILFSTIGFKQGTSVYALKNDGSDFPGWPQVSYRYAMLTPPIVGDIDNDKKLEIISAHYFVAVPTLVPKIYAWDYDGSLLQGWPRSGGSHIPSIGDVIHDESVETLISYWSSETGGGGFAALDSSGNIIYTSTKENSVPYSPFVIADISSSAAVLYAAGRIMDPYHESKWDIASTVFSLEIVQPFGELGEKKNYADERMHWPTVQHDVARTGAFTPPYCSMPLDEDGDGLGECREFFFGTDPLNPDTDGDMCRDGAEVGNDPTVGGQRDPLNPWDFYDVPVPAIGSNGTIDGEKNGAVNMGDVLAVLYYFGAGTPYDNLEVVDGKYTCVDPQNQTCSGNGVCYCDDLNQNGIADGAEYDRRASSVPSNIYALGPPDGIVMISDILAIYSQFDHSCQ